MMEAICTCTGKSEEVTGSLMLTLIVETWTILQQFVPPERFLPFDYDKNKRVFAVVGSIHDPSAVCFQPSSVCKHVTYDVSLLFASTFVHWLTIISA